MAQKDYYSILGVDRNATEDEIKKAYKKLCIKYHPDKWVNASEKERKEAENKFKEVNEANSVLSDKQKRQNYDNFGTTEGFQGQGFDPFGDDDPFAFFRSRRTPKGVDITAEVVLTFKESFVGGRKSIKANRLRECSKCHGTGSADGLEHKCHHCGGTGKIRSTRQFGNASFVSETICPYCGGTGKEIVNKCTHCNGTGIEQYGEEMEIEIPRGIFDGATVTYEGMGEPSPMQGGLPGDLIITFKVLPEKNFRKEGNDLVYNLELSLLEAWCGCKKTVEHPDGMKINVTIPELTKSGKRFSVRGKGYMGNHNGLFRTSDGDFIIEVSYKVPEKPLTNAQKEILNKFYE